MPALEDGRKKSSIDIMRALSCISVFVYIISAIAFELTANTARISTLAIYLVFAVGVLFLIGNTKVLFNPYVFSLVFFFTYVFIRTEAKNASPTEANNIAYWVLTCTVLCVLVFWMSLEYVDMLPLAMIAYIIGAVVLSARIVIEYGGIASIIELASSEGENRIGGLLGNSNSIGLFLANGVLCGMVFFTKQKKAVWKVVLLICMILLAMMLLLTGSRKSLAFVLLGIAMFVFFYYRTEAVGKKIVAYAGLAVGIFLVYKFITQFSVFSTINERLELLFDGFLKGESGYETDDTRKDMISKGLKAFWERPLFGHGTGYSHVLFDTYSHNNFVELLMNYGVIGFLLYYAPLLLLIVRLFKRVLQRDILSVYLFTYMCLQILLGVGWVNYYDRSVQILVALAFGYLCNVEKEEWEANESDEDR